MKKILLLAYLLLNLSWSLENPKWIEIFMSLPFDRVPNGLSMSLCVHTWWTHISRVSYLWWDLITIQTLWKDQMNMVTNVSSFLRNVSSFLRHVNFSKLLHVLSQLSKQSQANFTNCFTATLNSKFLLRKTFWLIFNNSSGIQIFSCEFSLKFHRKVRMWFFTPLPSNEMVTSTYQRFLYFIDFYV